MNVKQSIDMLKGMIRIREFERVIKELYKAGYVEGAIHCYTGEEAVAIGACHALRKEDYVFSTHRGHGHAIAKGCSLERVFAELMGRETGVSKGMGGSMHLFDIENGLMGGNGIVGGGLTLALGTAYASRYRDLDRVTVCFFSEGASNQGTFHESINMAALWRLPIVYICENNLFAATTPSYKTLSHPDVARRATGYGIPGIIADGNDVNDVYEKTLEAIERARKGQGPTLLECKTYRVEGHCMVLKDLPQHRPRKEVEGWQDRDPIDLLEKELMKEKGIDLNIRGVVFEEVQEEFKAAIEYAKSSRKPDCDAFDRIVKERYPL